MIEQVLSRGNLTRAYRQVVSNKGSAGVDGMSAKELYAYLTKNRERIESELRQGRYLSQPILGVEIPKSNGKTRLLGIPMVIDRLLQQAVGQVHKSNHAARKIGNSIYLFLKDKLKLPINNVKSGIRKP